MTPQPKMKNPINALIVGYRDDRIAEHVKSLERLREEGLVEKISALSSGISSDSSNPPGNYSAPVNFTTEIQRDYPEAGFENPEGFSRYCKDIKKTISQTGSTLVLPTTDRAVIAIASIFGNKSFVDGVSTSCPGIDIVDTFQDKGSTYSFFNNQNITRTPSYRTINTSDLGKLKGQILLHGVAAPYFAKPSHPQRGGGAGAGKVSRATDVQRLMIESGYNNYLISELLNGPEINHTIIINPNGTVATQCTYEEISNTDRRKQRVSIQNDELDNFGYKFGESLRDNFGGSNFRGVYNIDFLRDSSNNLVISEINPGRFPACMSIFNNENFNLLKPLLSTVTGKSEKYPGSYTIGKHFNC